MNIDKINLVYFSATDTTKKTLRYISEETGVKSVKEYNITQGWSEEVNFTERDLVVFGVPVYSGRVPAIAVDALNRFKGNFTPAVAVCVYGNREYDDALSELKNIAEAGNFKVIAAGAFLAQHSIFPTVAAGRPDPADKITAAAFGRKVAEQAATYDQISDIPEIKVKGNFPYREPGKIPFRPKGDSKCDKCGTCVKECPAKAIEATHPRKTDKTRCISCARCIRVCPQDARHFHGIIYKIIRKKFYKAYSVRKEAETFFG